MSNPLSDLNDEDFAIAHRQWIRANLLKKRFEDALSKTAKDVRSDRAHFYLNDAGVLMLLWYGMLFSVMEYLREKQIDITGLDGNYADLYSKLRRTRNSVFHAEKKYWDKRQDELMQIRDGVERIRHVHTRLGEYFIELLQDE